jgi:hypothetical protein
MVYRPPVSIVDALTVTPAPPDPTAIARPSPGPPQPLSQPSLAWDSVRFSPLTKLAEDCKTTNHSLLSAAAALASGRDGAKFRPS